MESNQKLMMEYKKQLEKGSIQKAYKGLMDYTRGLRTHFQNKYPDLSGSAGMYYGYMDMTYFPLFPKSLKDRKLKIAVVFLHEAFRFEVWLTGVNKEVQEKYWNLIKESGWDQYPLVPTTQGVDAILEHVLVDNPNFDDTDALTRQIESGTLKFIREVEHFLSAQ